MDDDVLGRRSVRRLQAVRIGGEPVHHRVPVLRAPAAPARAEAAARGRAGPRAARGVLGRGSRCVGGRRPREACAAARARRRLGRASRWAPTRPYATIALVAVELRGCGCCCAPATSCADNWSSSGRCTATGGSCSAASSSYLERLVRVRHAARRSRSSAGCWSGATARSSCWRCSSAPASRGALVALAVYPLPVVVGGNAGALALLAAWAAPDLRGARAATTTRATCSARARSRRCCWRCRSRAPRRAGWRRGRRRARPARRARAAARAEHARSRWSAGAAASRRRRWLARPYDAAA